jgi:hypothetical protein
MESQTWPVPSSPDAAAKVKGPPVLTQGVWRAVASVGEEQQRKKNVAVGTSKREREKGEKVTVELPTEARAADRRGHTPMPTTAAR